MPRTNPGRKIEAERLLARRITLERVARGWSNETLAERMSDAGCQIQPSALYKIQSGERPRRITVDELVGLSAALGVSVQDLLAPSNELITGLVKDRFAAWVRACDEQDRLAARTRELAAQVRELLDQVPEMEQPLRVAVADWLRDYAGYDTQEAVDAAMRTFTRESEPLPLPSGSGQRRVRRRS